METILLSLGTNQGDREYYLTAAVEQLNEKLGATLHMSPIYETDAWGLTEQPAFLNICAMGITSLSPHGLLETIQHIESELGRQRQVHWGQRTIDIDILCYGDLVINEPNLVIPHPLMAERRFVLVPLNDIAANWIHPTLHKSVRTLLEECPDTLGIKRLG